MAVSKNNRHEENSEESKENHEEQYDDGGRKKYVVTSYNKKGSFLDVMDGSFVKWITTSIIGFLIASGTYYVKTEYVSRREVEEKYTLKRDFENRVVFLESSMKGFVRSDVYDTKMADVQSTLTRIERTLDDNNKYLRDFIEKYSAKSK